MDKNQPELDKKPEKKRRRVSAIWSLLWLLLIAFLYANRNDNTYAFTVWPAWIWMLPGLFLYLLSKPRPMLILLAYGVFGWFFVDEAKSYPRMILPVGEHELRVVSLNCAGGSVAAAEEVMAQKPDIVFFEESPASDEVAKLATKFFGKDASFVSGPDASIIARGKLKSISDRWQNNHVGVFWEDGKGRSLNLVALRLQPPTMRIDLFNPDAWKEFAANRVSRRKEVEEMDLSLGQQSFKVDLLGGDFNTPPDGRLLAPITEGLSDAFASVGRGYGATCVHPYPCLVRIDQIWHSPKLEAVNCFVVPTENSDHRMLIADFRWK